MCMYQAQQAWGSLWGKGHIEEGLSPALPRKDREADNEG